SWTLDEFPLLALPFASAFHAHMRARRLDGTPGQPAGLPWTSTAPERRRKIGCSSSWSPSKPLRSRSYKAAYAGWGQSTAHQWMPGLLPVLLAALRALGDAPARSVTALVQRLGVSETDAATVVVPLEEEPAPVIAVLAAAPRSPLCAHDGTERRIVRPQDPPAQAQG